MNLGGPTPYPCTKFQSDRLQGFECKTGQTEFVFDRTRVPGVSCALKTALATVGGHRAFLSD